MKGSYLLIGGFLIAAYWVYNKLYLFENVSVEPVSFKVEPGFLNTKANLSILIKNSTGKNAYIKGITGKIFFGENEIGVFQNKPSFEIKRMSNVIFPVFGDFKTTAILENLNSKEIKIRGVAYVDNVFIPFEKNFTV
jgi:penicillin V acylase-like amidase (Ntn superfamily)